MPKQPNRVALDRVDWLNVLPVLRLGSAFRHALQPGKLIVALLAVLALHGCGLLLDVVWPSETRETASSSPALYAQGFEEPGVYETFIALAGGWLGALFDSAIGLEHGFGREPGVVDALHGLFIQTPVQLFDQHPWFVLVFGLIALVVLGLSSGLICRMAAVNLCMGQSVSVLGALRFVKSRRAWYLLTPLMPTVLVLLIGVVLILLGLVFFNVPVLDVIGSLLFGLMLILGLVIALVTILLLFAWPLMAPALSVEGSDGFDAIARSFNYVMYRPWQFAAYLFASLIYLGFVYVLLISVAGLTVYATSSFVGVGGFLTLDQAGETYQDESGVRVTVGVADQHAINRVLREPANTFEGTTAVTAWVMQAWVKLLMGVVIALMFSVLCCLQTQVYLLMRRSADGTPLDDCAADEEQELWSSPEDMVDPEAQAIAAAGPSAAKQAPAEPQDLPDASSTPDSEADQPQD